MTLSAQDRKRFRSIAHSLNPVVTVAQKGLNEGVCAEIERALEQHELIKVRISVGDRESRRELAAAISEQTGAEVVQSIGNIVLLYRAAEKPQARLSNLLRHGGSGRS